MATELDNDTTAYDYATFPKRFVTYRWFKPLLVAILAFAFMVAFQLALVLAAVVAAGSIDFIYTIGTDYDSMDPFNGPGALVEIGSIAVILPALALAARIVRDRPCSSYSSSRGGWKWSAFGKCLAVAVAVMAVFTVVQVVALPDENATGANRFTVAGFVACMVLVPIQCAAEEYMCRGFFLQTFASWTKLPIVGIIAQAVLFTALHGYNSIGMLSVFVNGLVWGYVACKTRGLEATCALHIANNMFAFFLTGFGVQSLTSEIDIASAVIAMCVDVVYAVAVILLGKRFAWFAPTGNGTTRHNEKYAAQIAAKRQAKQRRWKGANASPDQFARQAWEPPVQGPVPTQPAMQQPNPISRQTPLEGEATATILQSENPTSQSSRPEPPARYRERQSMQQPGQSDSNYGSYGK